jgi:hypothetical protein
MGATGFAGFANVESQVAPALAKPVALDVISNATADKPDLKM